MSDQNNSGSTKNENRRFLGKVKTINTKYGGMQKIYMDNLENVNKDGTPNTFYKGALIWADAVTGQNYHVKQMSFFVPKNGMRQEDINKGFSCYVTLTLDDNYEVTVLA